MEFSDSWQNWLFTGCLSLVYDFHYLAGDSSLHQNKFYRYCRPISTAIRQHNDVLPQRPCCPLLCIYYWFATDYLKPTG